MTTEEMPGTLSILLYWEDLGTDGGICQCCIQTGAVYL